MRLDNFDKMGPKKLTLLSICVSFFLILDVNCVPIEKNVETQCGYKSCTTEKEGYVNVHLVPHTHDDVGWVKSLDEYYYGTNTKISTAGVQYILDTVIDSLQRDSSRKFIYVETAFFWKWWVKQNDKIKTIVKQLVDNGQLEFISGGWSMNDEAVTNYQSTIDQMTWGLRRLNDTFGECGRPRVSWQIDPFGHSREMADIFKRLGFDAFFINRIDYADKSIRATDKELEFMWKTNDVLDDSNIFTSILLKHYSPPSGLCFDVNCNDNPVVDDIESPEYNVKQIMEYMSSHVNELMRSYKTSNVLVTMGDDFTYMNAEKWYSNMDKLISAVNAAQVNGSIYNLFYSTPSCYIKSVYDETKGRVNATLKEDDFFPYASDSSSYWTGFYSSRPALKRFERIGNNVLQICKQLTTLAGLTDSEDKEKLNILREAMGVLQHHDAITGTEKMVVGYDYARILHKGISSCEDLTISALNILSKETELQDDFPNLNLTTCPLTNLSDCSVSEKENKFIVTVYNPLARTINKFVRLPVSGTAYVITDSDGASIESDLIPIPRTVQILPGRHSNATVELTFLAGSIPPLGYKTYFIEKTSSNYVIPQDNRTTTVNSSFVGVGLDSNTGFLKNIQVNGTNYEVNQSLWYYIGNFNSGRASGAYVFRPSVLNEANNYTNFYNVTDKTQYYEIYKGKLVTEIHQYFTNCTSQVIRLYKDESFVEFNWLIGSTNIDYIGQTEVVGKEYVTKFETALKNDKTFYTDSNGRQEMKRILNYRPSWNATVSEPAAGNYYPVTSKISIKDEEENLEFAVLTDRAQGGSSLEDGEVELMLYRNCRSDDGFGVNEALIESQFDTFLAARGLHYVFIGSSGATLKQLERDIELRTLFDSWVFLAETNDYTFESFKASHLMEYSGLNQALPYGVHLMTLEPWKDSSLLLRLEHSNEVENDVSLDIQDIFASFTLKSIKETTLGGNQWLEDNETLDFVQVGNEASPIEKEFLNNVSDVNDFNITLKPTQIRTFIVEYEF